jgi:hypothetical protein
LLKNSATSLKITYKDVVLTNPLKL